MKDYILNLDRPRKLIYDFDAWDIIAEKYGPKESKEDFDISKLNITYNEIPFLVYAGLRWEDPKIDEAAVKGLLNEKIRSGDLTIIDIMQSAVNAIFAQSGLKEVPIREALEKVATDAQKKISASTTKEPGSKKEG